MGYVVIARSTVRNCGTEDDWQHSASHVPPPVHVCRHWHPTVQGHTSNM